jgi:hypothetical protein
MLPERRLRRAPGAREVPEHSASPRDRQSKARAGRTVKVRLLGSPALMGATGIEPAWSQPAHRTPNAQACAHALDQLHRLFDLEESW